MTLRRIFVGTFTHQAELRPWRFVGLAIALALSAVQVVLQVWDLSVEHSPNYHPDRFSGYVLPLMVLLNFLAFDFRWSPRGTVVMRVTAWVWLIFGCLYILAWD